MPTRNRGNMNDMPRRPFDRPVVTPAGNKPPVPRDPNEGRKVPAGQDKIPPRERPVPSNGGRKTPVNPPPSQTNPSGRVAPVRPKRPGLPDFSSAARKKLEQMKG